MIRIKRLILLLLGIVLLTLPFSLTAQDNTEDAHRQTILRMLEEGFSQGNLDVIDEVFATDYVNHTTDSFISDRESFKDFISKLRKAMPVDLEANVEMVITNGDWMSFRLIITGTFYDKLSLFPGITPSGDQLQIIQHVTLRFNEDGQVVEEWDMLDKLGLLTQLEILPPMETSTSVIFAIGYENSVYSEFNRNLSTDEFSCTVGIDCSNRAFPDGIALAGACVSSHSCLTGVTIHFSLEQTYNNVILRLARAGNETTVVTIDSERTYYVTNEMLGSFDGGHFGIYNLRLGTLVEGAHSIRFTIADDGNGNGAYQWDAITLLAT